MADPFGIGADVHFASLPDWRKEKDAEDPDDSQVQTPTDVSLILGFDPAELESDGKEGTAPVASQ